MSMRISTPLLQQNGVNSLLEQQSKLATTQKQLATGRRVLTPSMDPVAATLTMEMNQALKRNEQFEQNANYAESRIRLAESNLEGVVNTLQRVRELAVQSLNGTIGPVERRAIAAEVRERFDEMLALANSSDGAGGFIFAGFKESQRPFVGDIDTGIGYIGDQGGRQLQVGPERRVAVSDSGHDIFIDADGQNIFTSLSSFVTDLEANVRDDVVLTNLDNAMQSVLTIRAKIGGRLNAIDDQRNINSAYTLNLKESVSELMDLDYAEAVARLNIQMTGFQAAQQSYVKIQGLSLFNYL